MNMNLKMLINDFKRNRAGNVALLLFMILATTLVVAASIVVTQLLSSITGMYHTAKPPHFLQMHKGEINQETIDTFCSSYDGITAYQTVSMIDVYGEDIKIKGEQDFDLSDCRIDISLVKQNKAYDLLLDDNRAVIHLKKGEIGIPVILLDAYDINLGDTVVISNHGVTKEFNVTAFVHDAQMNSTLCSSTRLLISDEDYEALYGKMGEKEYLIEAYFTDSAFASDFQTAYEKANLPQDGQAVTYRIIFLLSALTDISLAMILIFVSMLLVIVALMCTKYTMMAALEEEISEIGTMKAIGMSYKDIRNLYLKKYKIMVTVGIIVGYILALILSNLFTGHVSTTFGKQPVSILTIILPIVGCLLVYFITNHYCKRILRKLKKVTVVDTLVTGKGFGKGERVKDGLYKSNKMPVNLLMSVRETAHNFGGYTIVFIVMFLVIGIMVVPMNLFNTMKSKEFITYMGSSMEDIMIEIEPSSDLLNKYERVKTLLKEDMDIKEYKEYKGVRVEAFNVEKEWVNLHIDCGNHAGEELKYLYGKAPLLENEIALSKLNADAVGKNVGDVITIRLDDKKMEFIVSGIYQDVTSGGLTAKAIYPFPDVESEKYQFMVNLASKADAKEKALQWSDRIGGGCDIEPMEAFINQTLGGVTRQVKIAAFTVMAIGILLAALMVVLFMKLRLAKDVSQIAAMKAIGFTNYDVRRQYLYKIGMVSLLGIFLGSILSNVLGGKIVSVTFGMMGLGITKVSFIINPWIAFFVLPVVLLSVVAGVTFITSRQICDYQIISLINE